MKKIFAILVLAFIGCGTPDDIEKTESAAVYVGGWCPSWVTGRYKCAPPSLKSLCTYEPYPGHVSEVYGCKYPTCTNSVCFNSYCDVTCN